MVNETPAPALAEEREPSEKAVTTSEEAIFGRIGGRVARMRDLSPGERIMGEDDSSGGDAAHRELRAENSG